MSKLKPTLWTISNLSFWAGAFTGLSAGAGMGYFTGHMNLRKNWSDNLRNAYWVSPVVATGLAAMLLALTVCDAVIRCRNRQSQAKENMDEAYVALPGSAQRMEPPQGKAEERVVDELESPGASMGVAPEKSQSMVARWASLQCTEHLIATAVVMAGMQFGLSAAYFSYIDKTTLPTRLAVNADWGAKFSLGLIGGAFVLGNCIMLVNKLCCERSASADLMRDVETSPLPRGPR